MSVPLCGPGGGNGGNSKGSASKGENKLIEHTETQLNTHEVTVPVGPFGDDFNLSKAEGGTTGEQGQLATLNRTSIYGKKSGGTVFILLLFSSLNAEDRLFAL